MTTITMLQNAADTHVFRTSAECRMMNRGPTVPAIRWKSNHIDCNRCAASPHSASAASFGMLAVTSWRAASLCILSISVKISAVSASAIRAR